MSRMEEAERFLESDIESYLGFFGPKKAVRIYTTVRMKTIVANRKQTGGSPCDKTHMMFIQTSEFSEMPRQLLRK